MSSIDTKHAVLTAHPSTPNHAVRSLGVQLRAEVPVQHQLTGEPNRWIRLDEDLRRLGRQFALEETVRRPGGARTIAKRELHQLKHRLQKRPSAARANDKPT
jgi:hypothetical protein